MDCKNTELNASFSGVKVHPNAYVDPSAELHDGVLSLKELLSVLM